MDRNTLEFVTGPNRGDGAEASSLRSTPLTHPLRADLRFYNKAQGFDTHGGDLPHREHESWVQYVTFRLGDSMPQSKLHEITELKNKFTAKHPEPWDEITTRAYYATVSPKETALLDAGYGECILKSPQVRKVVSDAIMHFNGTRYHVYSYVIMPNHVHLLLSCKNGHSLDSILHSIKSYSANEINKLLGREGHVWQRESFDRFVRSERDFDRILKYIKDNTMGLDNRWFSYFCNNGIKGGEPDSPEAGSLSPIPPI